jgi:HEPN domain-containing protein
MLSKQKHIEYWLKSAEKDKEVIDYLFKGKKYVHALFFAHLFLEKLCKASWIKKHAENNPPKIHNLLKLIKEAAIELSEQDQLFLLKLNQYQIEGRYPDDIEKLYRVTNQDLAENYILETNRIAKCIQEHLQ